MVLDSRVQSFVIWTKGGTGEQVAATDDTEAAQHEGCKRNDSANEWDGATDRADDDQQRESNEKK